MEERKSSNKTRSSGEASSSPRNTQTPLSTSSASRPEYRERVKSAPLGVLQSEEQQWQKTSQRTLAVPVKKETAAHAQPHRSDGPVGDVQEVTLAVLGAPVVGKSTFVRSSLDLKKPPTSPLSSKKVSLEGEISIVRLLELGFQELGITANQNVRWPARVGDHNTPMIDGVLALYNVMDQGSIALIPALLRALSRENIPTILVSARSDSPPASWEVNRDMIEQLCSVVTGIESYPVSLSAPETHKRCISIILRKIMVKRRESDTLVCLTRPRALTSTETTISGGTYHLSHPARAWSKHGRAASEMSSSVAADMEPVTLFSSMPRTPAASIESQTSFFLTRDENVNKESERSPIVGPSCRSLYASDDIDDRPVSSRRATEDLQSENFPTTETMGQVSDMFPPSIDHVPGSRDVQDISVDQNGPLSVQNSKSAETEDDDGKELGLTFEDLVDRLLAQPISKSDSKFAAIFLSLYRKFASPSALTKAIIRHFEELNDQDLHQLTRTTSQLRYLNILRDWVSDYPGDFAHPLTRRFMTAFLQTLTATPEYAIAYKEISHSLDLAAEDDDIQWACPDQSRCRADTTDSFLTMSSVQSGTSTINADSPTLTANSSTEDIVEHVGPEKPQSNRTSGTLSSVPSINRSESRSNGSFQTLLSALENSQRQAQLLTPIPRNLLTKVQWRHFMDIAEEEIAQELTRIDWIMYCSIRPRDLIRHVSLATDQKEKCKSLEHVNRMIHQFNHVAFWVANVILLRDKPKHRAKSLEKFMSVAWKLRYLNNYNSLGAVISGINSIAVHRLAQTRELIPAPAQKQFMRLEILMGSQKSHSAYRLAWTNTPTQRIPFLPLHLRDLVLAEQGNRTYVPGTEGERINWKKFEIMGEVIIGIQKSQKVLYPTINKNEEVQRLVLDGRFCEDEDELYERSVQLEGQGVGETTRKKFNWFQR